jgi:hypothetical protein
MLGQCTHSLTIELQNLLTANRIAVNGILIAWDSDTLEAKERLTLGIFNNRETHFFSPYVFILESILKGVNTVQMFFLENRSIATNTIHDSSDTVQANTFAHMLYKCSTVTVVSN